LGVGERTWGLQKIAQWAVSLMFLICCCWVDQLKENEMNKTCSTHGNDEHFVQNFAWKSERKETT
jgi:hypothetical protein